MKQVMYLLVKPQTAEVAAVIITPHEQHLSDLWMLNAYGPDHARVISALKATRFNGWSFSNWHVIEGDGTPGDLTFRTLLPKNYISVEELTKLADEWKAEAEFQRTTDENDDKSEGVADGLEQAEAQLRHAIEHLESSPVAVTDYAKTLDEFRQPI